MAQQPKIIEQQVIVVDFTDLDDYGNLQVTDKGGGTTKISKKRESLHGLFQEGRAVELFFAKYMDTVYVADAKAVAVPEGVEPVAPPPQIDEPSLENDYPPEDRSAQPAPKFQVDGRTHDIHRQCALKCATRLAGAGLIKLSELKEKSDMLLRYLDGE